MDDEAGTKVPEDFPGCIPVSLSDSEDDMPDWGTSESEGDKQSDKDSSSSESNVARTSASNNILSSFPRPPESPIPPLESILRPPSPENLPSLLPIVQNATKPSVPPAPERPQTIELECAPNSSFPRPQRVALTQTPSLRDRSKSHAQPRDGLRSPPRSGAVEPSSWEMRRVDDCRRMPPRPYYSPQRRRNGHVSYQGRHRLRAKYRPPDLPRSRSPLTVRPKAPPPSHPARPATTSDRSRSPLRPGRYSLNGWQTLKHYVRSAPNTDSKVVATLSEWESVDVLEFDQGWGKIAWPAELGETESGENRFAWVLMTLATGKEYFEYFVRTDSTKLPIVTSDDEAEQKRDRENLRKMYANLCGAEYVDEDAATGYSAVDLDMGLPTAVGQRPTPAWQEVLDMDRSSQKLVVTNVEPARRQSPVKQNVAHKGKQLSDQSNRPAVGIVDNVAQSSNHRKNETTVDQGKPSSGHGRAACAPEDVNKCSHGIERVACQAEDVKNCATTGIPDRYGGDFVEIDLDASDIEDDVSTEWLGLSSDVGGDRRSPQRPLHEQFEVHDRPLQQKNAMDDSWPPNKTALPSANAFLDQSVSHKQQSQTAQPSVFLQEQSVLHNKLLEGGPMAQYQHPLKRNTARCQSPQGRAVEQDISLKGRSAMHRQQHQRTTTHRPCTERQPLLQDQFSGRQFDVHSQSPQQQTTRFHPIREMQAMMQQTPMEGQPVVTSEQRQRTVIRSLSPQKEPSFQLQFLEGGSKKQCQEPPARNVSRVHSPSPPGQSTDEDKLHFLTFPPSHDHTAQNPLPERQSTAVDTVLERTEVKCHQPPTANHSSLRERRPIDPDGDQQEQSVLCTEQQRTAMRGPSPEWRHMEQDEPVKKRSEGQCQQLTPRKAIHCTSAKRQAIEYDKPLAGPRVLPGQPLQEQTAIQCLAMQEDCVSQDKSLPEPCVTYDEQKEKTAIHSSLSEQPSSMHSRTALPQASDAVTGLKSLYLSEPTSPQRQKDHSRPQCRNDITLLQRLDNEEVRHASTDRTSCASPKLNRHVVLEEVEITSSTDSEADDNFRQAATVLRRIPTAKQPPIVLPHNFLRSPRATSRASPSLPAMQSGSRASHVHPSPKSTDENSLPALPPPVSKCTQLLKTHSSLHVSSSSLPKRNPQSFATHASSSTTKAAPPSPKSKATSKATVPPQPNCVGWATTTTVTLEDPVIRQHVPTPVEPGDVAWQSSASKSDSIEQAKNNASSTSGIPAPPKKGVSKRTREQRLLKWQLETERREVEFEEWQQRQRRRAEQEQQWLGIGPSTTAPVVAEDKIKKKSAQSAPYDNVLQAFFASLS